MLRIIGAAMLLAASAALGFSAAGGLSARVRELELIILSLKSMERELAGRLTPLPELLRRTMICMEGNVKEFYLLCLSGLEKREGDPFAEIWREAAEGAQLRLDEHALRVLEDVGSILGRYDAASQCAALRESRERLSAALEEASVQQAQMGRVYRTLGLASGALLVIVLL